MHVSLGKDRRDPYLGIRAPRDVTVHRKEIYEQIAEENKGASDVRPEDLPE